jgi:hypothetical protein
MQIKTYKNLITKGTKEDPQRAQRINKLVCDASARATQLTINKYQLPIKNKNVRHGLHE